MRVAHQKTLARCLPKDWKGSHRTTFPSSNFQTYNLVCLPASYLTYQSKKCSSSAIRAWLSLWDSRFRSSLPYWSYNKWTWLERWHIDLLYRKGWTLFVLRNEENPPSLEKEFLTPKFQRRLGWRLLRSPSFCDSDRLGFVSQPEGVVGLTQTKR